MKWDRIATQVVATFLMLTEVFILVFGVLGVFFLMLLWRCAPWIIFGLLLYYALRGH